MSEKHQCAGAVTSAGRWRSYQCSATGKFEHEGRHYCGRHHPPTLKAKEDEKQAEWKARSERLWAARNEAESRAAEQKRRAECFPDLLEALILMVRTHDEPADSLLDEAKEQQWLAKARAAIARATQ